MTGNNMTEAESVEAAGPQPARAVNDRLIDELVVRAQAEGLQALGGKLRDAEASGARIGLVNRGSGGQPRRRRGSSRVGGRS